jgi:hypothetical protein
MKVYIAAAIALALPMVSIGSPVQAAGARCAQEDSVRSLQGNASTSITFVNATRGPIRLYWIDYNGRRKFYAEVRPGQRHLQQTYVTHPWVVTNFQEDCLGVYFPDSYPQRIVIGG